jgi:hypothetical protein
MPSHHRFGILLILTLTLCTSLLRPGPVAADTKPKLTVARDWKANPAIVEIDTKDDVYALGDIHGDYDRLVTLLVGAHIIKKDPVTPEKATWDAGRSVLVCTGDMIDKWTQSLPVLALLRALQADAERAGGRVVVLMGNHEAEFLADAGRNKKTIDFTTELTRKGIKPAAVAAGTDTLGLGAFLRGLPFAARVNDWFFAHAGNTHGRSLARLEHDLREGVESKGFKALALSAVDSLLEARLHPRPWWERPGDTGAKARNRLAGHIEALGVRHLVMGHQPGKVVFADGGRRRDGELYQHFDGLIFLIDAGMSRGIGYSTGALLHLPAGKRERAISVFANGTTKQIWKAPRAAAAGEVTREKERNHRDTETQRRQKEER